MRRLSVPARWQERSGEHGQSNDRISSALKPEQSAKESTLRRGIATAIMATVEQDAGIGMLRMVATPLGLSVHARVGFRAEGEDHRAPRRTSLPVHEDVEDSIASSSAPGRNRLGRLADRPRASFHTLDDWLGPLFSIGNVRTRTICVNSA
jgi:hypothetical protein